MKKFLALACALLALAACGRKPRHDYSNVPDKDQVVDGGTRVDETGGEATTLNPILVQETTGLDLVKLMFCSLVKLNAELELEGDLAESWKFSKDGRDLTFKLRHGVLWHDGVPVTSKDVKFTLKMVMDPKTITPMKSDYELVSGIDTPDDFTVVVHYKQPFAPALESWTIQPIPEHLLKDVKDINTAAYNRAPVGNGPYKFVKWKDKQMVELEANPAYYKGKPHISRYVLRYIPEPSTQLLELKAGGIDVMGLTPDQFARETDGEDFKRMAVKIRFPGYRSYDYMAYNFKNPLFADRRVRLAFSHAVDRKALIDGVLLGYGQPSSGPYVPSMPAYNHDVKPIPFDLSKSAALLDEAGWRMGKQGIREKAGKPLAFRLITSKGGDTRERVCLILQQQFAKLGAKVEVQTYEWSTFISNYVNKKDFDAVVLGWQLSIDPDQYAIWHSSQTHEMENNFISYSNPEVDRLLVQGRVTFDKAARMAIYKRIHKILAEDQPYCFLYVGDGLGAYSRKFQGVKLRPTGIGWGWTNDWYVPASLQQ